MVFVESLFDEDEMRQAVATVPRPLKINMLEGGRTPRIGFEALFALGFRLVNYSGLLQRAAMKAMQVALQVLQEEGVTTSLHPDRVMTLTERNALLGLSDFYALEERLYGPLLESEGSWRHELEEVPADIQRRKRRLPI